MNAYITSKMITHQSRYIAIVHRPGSIKRGRQGRGGRPMSAGSVSLTPMGNKGHELGFGCFGSGGTEGVEFRPAFWRPFAPCFGWSGRWPASIPFGREFSFDHRK
jgi:hypothetical protein